MPFSRALAACLAVACAGALALAAAAFLQRTDAAGVVEVRLPAAATPSPADGLMKVYIAGAVQRPGVYPVRPGDRLADAIEAAGGPTDDADLPAVNLARRLHDEDHIVIPRQGQTPPVAVEAEAVGPARIDLNSASAAALETLPGVGPARAKGIVDSRQRVGRFTEPVELVRRRLVPQSVYDGFKDRVEAR